MNPKPFESLNHFTVPVVRIVLLLRECAVFGSAACRTDGHNVVDYDPIRGSSRRFTTKAKRPARNSAGPKNFRNMSTRAAHVSLAHKLASSSGLRNQASRKPLFSD